MGSPVPRACVLLLTNAYPDFESSHRGTFIRKMALSLKERRYAVCVVTPKIYGESLRFEEQDGVRVYRFPFRARNKLLVEYKRVPWMKMIFYFLSGTLWTWVALARNRPKFIHVHWAIPTGLIGVLVSRMTKLPMLVTVHGSDFRLATEGSRFLREAFLLVCRSARLVSCVSAPMKEGLVRLGIQADKITVFPMGVDDAFVEVGEKRSTKQGGEPHVVLSNRSLYPLYNVSLLVRAIPLVLREEPHTTFVIAGDGSQKETLEKEAASCSMLSSVSFLGAVPHDRMPSLLAEADIFVSTSLADGTSVSLLEAMAAGAFPIVTAIPSNHEWIDDGKNGFLVSTGREEELAQRILEAIRNERLAEESRRSNLAIIHRQGLWSSTMALLEGVYRRL